MTGLDPRMESWRKALPWMWLLWACAMVACYAILRDAKVMAIAIAWGGAIGLLLSVPLGWAYDRWEWGPWTAAAFFLPAAYAIVRLLRAAGVFP